MRILLLLSVVTWQAIAAPSTNPSDPVNYDFFSTNVFKAVAEDVSGNFIFSPLSAFMSLSMATFGARGETEQKLRTALSLSNDNDAVKHAFQTMVDAFTENNQSHELRLANKVFLSRKFQLKPEFMEVTKTYFRSEAQSLDFSESVKASKTINDWCEHQTNHRIKDLIKPDDLSGATAFLLVNAVQFKGDWATKFDAASTKPRPFYVDATTVKDVPTMYRSGSYRYGHLPEVKAKFVELPYKGSYGDMSMFIIVPDEITGLVDLEKNFEKVTVEQLLRGMESTVDVYLPKFRIESEIEFEKPLSKLGLGDIFRENANFSGITDSSPLRITKFVQKAFIEVNEEGSEAAAGTALQGVAYSVPLKYEVRADHPFMFAIVKRSAVVGQRPIIFQGHYKG